MGSTTTYLCRFACAASMAFASMDACASTLFRCVAQDGAVAYQDVPCGGDTVLTRTIPVVGEAGGGEAGTKKKGAKQVPRKAEAGTTRKQNFASTSVRGERAKRRDACRAAREKREATLAQLGLRRTFEQLRALDDRVHDVCKGL